MSRVDMVAMSALAATGRWGSSGSCSLLSRLSVERRRLPRLRPLVAPAHSDDQPPLAPSPQPPPSAAALRALE